MRLAVVVLVSSFAAACIYEDVCVNGAVRVDGRCVRLGDASLSSDAGPDARGDASPVADAGTDATADDDSGVAGDAGVLRCIPSGSPVPVTTGGGAMELVRAVGFEGGYVVVWDGTDRRLRYGIADPSGTVTSGPSQLRSESTVTHADVSLTRVGDHAVALWSEGPDVWGRAIPLDGTSPSPAVSIAVGAAAGIAGTTAAPLTGGVRVAWRVESEIYSAVYNGPLAAELDPSGVVYTLVTPDAAANTGPALIPSPDGSHALLGFADQRAGDTGARAYVGRLEVTPEGIWTALGPALEGLSVEGAARPPASDGVAAAFMTIARSTAGGTRRVDLVEIEPRDIGEDVRIVRTTALASDDFFGDGAIVGSEQGFDTAWVRASGASAIASYAFVRSSGVVDGPHDFGAVVRARLSVARVDSTQAAVAFIEGAGPSDVFLQLIRCE